jgi:dTDP-4-dehydrorhamnose 3,5-epimerase-like enzyme
MAKILDIPKFSDDRGDLFVVENLIPFEIKRFYFIKSKNNKHRGHHRHKKTIQALICLSGKCEIYVNNNIDKNIYKLDSSKLLILNPEDWHYMFNFSVDSVLGVFASEFYCAKDYIDEEY